MFPEDDEIAGKTTKPFYMHFLKKMKLRLFSSFFGWLSKSGSGNPQGQHALRLRSSWKKVRAGKLFDKQREALSVSVAMGCQSWNRRVYLIMHFTKPAFKYPGGSWNRSLLLSRDSSLTSLNSETWKVSQDRPCLKHAIDLRGWLIDLLCVWSVLCAF